MQCANSHPTVNMIRVNAEYVGTLLVTWYQCPQCKIRRLLTSDGVLEEAEGLKTVAETRERNSRIAAEEARRRTAETEKERSAIAAWHARKREERPQQEERERSERKKDVIFSAIAIPGVILIAVFLVWRVALPFIGLFWTAVGVMALLWFLKRGFWDLD